MTKQRRRIRQSVILLVATLLASPCLGQDPERTRVVGRTADGKDLIRDEIVPADIPRDALPKDNEFTIRNCLPVKWMEGGKQVVIKNASGEVRWKEGGEMVSIENDFIEIRFIMRDKTGKIAPLHFSTVNVARADRPDAPKEIGRFRSCLGVEGHGMRIAVGIHKMDVKDRLDLEGRCFIPDEEYTTKDLRFDRSFKVWNKPGGQRVTLLVEDLTIPVPPPPKPIQIEGTIAEEVIPRKDLVDQAAGYTKWVLYYYPPDDESARSATIRQDGTFTVPLRDKKQLGGELMLYQSGDNVRRITCLLRKVSKLEGIAIPRDADLFVKTENLVEFDLSFKGVDLGWGKKFAALTTDIKTRHLLFFERSLDPDATSVHMSAVPGTYPVWVYWRKNEEKKEEELVKGWVTITKESAGKEVLIKKDSH